MDTSDTVETLGELGQLLVALGVPPDHYSLNGGLPSEAYVIERMGMGWRIYYSERGNRNIIEEFSRERDACTEFFRLIREEVFPGLVQRGSPSG